MLVNLVTSSTKDSYDIIILKSVFDSERIKVSISYLEELPAMMSINLLISVSMVLGIRLLSL
jgi:hypothetical protein